MFKISFLLICSLVSYSAFTSGGSAGGGGPPLLGSSTEVFLGRYQENELIDPNLGNINKILNNINTIQYVDGTIIDFESIRGKLDNIKKYFIDNIELKSGEIIKIEDVEDVSTPVGIDLEFFSPLERLD